MRQPLFAHAVPFWEHLNQPGCALIRSSIRSFVSAIPRLLPGQTPGLLYRRSSATGGNSHMFLPPQQALERCRRFESRILGTGQWRGSCPGGKKPTARSVKTTGIAGGLSRPYKGLVPATPQGVRKIRQSQCFYWLAPLTRGYFYLPLFTGSPVNGSIYSFMLI